jgi:pyruvate dehydrogenase E2 component (dihydrolipoamide acetyltransferase)
VQKEIAQACIYFTSEKGRDSALQNELASPVILISVDERMDRPMHELKLADLGEGMHEAEIVEWLVKEGEQVRLDQPVVRVETDKAIVEIPSPVAGRVSKLCFQPGQTAKVGDVLILYDNPDEQHSHVIQHGQNSHTVQQTSTTARTASTNGLVASTSTGAPATVGRGRVLAAPAVRKLAFELGIDLANVTPSASGGRVTIEDVRAYTEQTQTAAQLATTSPAPPALNIPASPDLSTINQLQATDERQPLTGLRRRIAEHMERAWRTIPHATSFDELDASALIALRQTLQPVAERRSVHLTYLPLLTKLLLPVLKEFPIFNASLDEESREIIYHRAYHLGIATASPDGLLVPVLRDAHMLTILQIATRLEQLIEGARKRTLALDELRGSTFTLNNVGSFGGSSGTPIINYPEAAILAVGRIEEKAVVSNGTLVAQPRMPLALSFDHRLIDGALAGAFLNRLKELVEHPQQLLLDMI